MSFDQWLPSFGAIGRNEIQGHEGAPAERTSKITSFPHRQFSLGAALQETG